MTISADINSIPGRKTIQHTKAEQVITWLMSLLSNSHPLCTAYSGGKDSSAVLVLMLEAIRRCKACGIRVPTCYVTNSDTLLENPAMKLYVDTMLDRIREHCKINQLPVQVLLATPSITSTFAYSTIGRGKLPRFANSKHRQCSIDWKVRPQEKLLKMITSESSAPDTQSLVCLVGTRFDESSSRQSKMNGRGEGDTILLNNPSGLTSNACIASWSLLDVWQLLMNCDASRDGSYDTFTPNFDWTLKLYKDANEGTCSIITGDRGNKAACGARFGCGLCTVNGDSDKSMESLIASDSEYSHLEGINRLRNLLISTRFDLDKRDWLGRTISTAGYVRISPDNYSSVFRRQLLRYLLTLDIEEQERAENHAESIAVGEVPNDDKNQRLAEIQFQFITPDLLLSIDLAWSLHGDFDHSFPAVREWYEIHSFGKRYPVPAVEEPRLDKIPKPRWFKVGTFDDWLGIDGLRDIYGEAVNHIRKPGRSPYKAYKEQSTGAVKKVIAFEEADQLTIDKEDASVFVYCEFEDIYFDWLNVDSRKSMFYLIDRGLIRFGKGHIAKYDQMAKRGQYYNRLKEHLNISDLKTHMLENSISDSDHNDIVAKYERESNVQHALPF